MDNEILYESVTVESDASVFLNYYIIPENISADYCDLKCYGIKIQKTVIYEGGGKMVESSQINNIFYKYNDVTEFLRSVIKKRTQPAMLREEVENYITESIDRARKSA